MVVDKKILDIQCASTRKSLERREVDDVEWRFREIPKEAQVVDENGVVIVGHRTFTDLEWKLGNLLQRRKGAYIAEAREETLVHYEMPRPVRNKAIDRFMGLSSVASIKAKFEAVMEACGLMVKNEQ